MAEMLVAILLIALAWSSYDAEKRMKEFDYRILRLERKIY